MSTGIYEKRKKDLDYHRQVWIEANGPIPDDYVVHHINHNKRDNRLENLVLMTHQEHSEHHNQKHPRVKQCEVCGVEYEPHPTKRARSKSCSPPCARELTARPQRKLTLEQITEFIARNRAGERQIDLAKEFGVSQSTISRLVSEAGEVAA